MAVTDVMSPDHPYHWMWAIYKPIDRFPHYLFGSDGSVWSRKVQCRWGITRGTYKKKKLGYIRRYHRYSVSLTETGGTMKNYPVSAVICEAFSGPKPEGTECLHNNGNSVDNRAENLRWGTRAENMQDAFLHETFVCGEKHFNCKLTSEQVAEIRRLRLETSMTQREIAKQFGVSQNTISGIVLAKRRVSYGESNPVYVQDNMHRGNKHWNAKLNWEIVGKIRDDLALGLSEAKVADKYKISCGQVHRIKHFKNWNPERDPIS